MIKAIVTSDLHAGIKSDNDIFLNTFSDFLLNKLPEKIDKHLKPNDYLFFLGDLFDNRNMLSNKTINKVLSVFEEFLTRYPSLNVYILVGNHDTYYKNRRDIHSLNLLKDKFQNKINIVDDFTVLKILNREIILYPWLTGEEDITKLYNTSPADICMGHFEINGALKVPGIREINGLSINEFYNKFKLTFSGHFHIRQELQKNDGSSSIIYVGNPYHMSWNDYENDKGIYILNLETLRYEFEKIDGLPEFKKLYLSQIRKKLVNLNSYVPNNFISLILDEDISTIHLDKLNYLISKFNPLIFNVIDKEKNFGDTDIQIDSVSTSLEFLIEYLTTINLYDNMNREVLIDKMTQLYQKMGGI